MEKREYTIIADPVVPDFDDGYLILDKDDRFVEAMDFADNSVWRWWMNRGETEGITVEIRTITYDRDREEGVETEWIPVPITIYPPPPEILAFLREGAEL